ncbi:helix-turn-helix domain-containing protein [Aliiroseovarius crassostreae]|nr:helix-turn-helix domain-containing protein [Aliiroseovarius crassostreae]
MPTRLGSIRSGVSDGQDGALHPKWKLLKAAEEAREPLGLKRTSLALLRTMISLVRANHISDAVADQHICFASNATLAERMHVSVKTVERHITILAATGLTWF